MNNTWYDADGVNRGRHIIYRDVTRPTPVPNVPWLLMEPIAHKSRRRTWVRFLKNPSFVKFLQNMHVCDKLCILVLGVCCFILEICDMLFMNAFDVLWEI